MLKKTADEIGKVVRDIPGRGDWRVQRVLGLPLLEVKPDRQRLARYGMSADRVLEVVEASRVGRFSGKIFEGSRRFDLMLLLPPATLTPEAFGELLVGSSTGHLVPLASVATIRETEGPAVINRESLQRRVLVEVNVRGRDLVSFVNEARAKVEQTVKLPEGVTLEWGGQFENFTRASKRLGFVAPVALAVIFAMLFLMFGDLRYAIAVFVNVPLALVGGVLALSAARPAVLDPGGGRLHRRRRRGRAQRRRHGRRFVAAPRPVGGIARRADPAQRRHGAAAGADDRARRRVRLHPDGDIDARGRRGAAAAGDRRHRRHHLVDAARPGGAAGDAAPAAPRPPGRSRTARRRNMQTWPTTGRWSSAAAQPADQRLVVRRAGCWRC